MNQLEQLTAALADRYVIERKIGAGGMATVYLARDVKHARPVAIKVLNAELGAVLGVERFLSEIRVTANLQHPNLLALFDSGESGGQLYYVMPYVEGESLRARMDREKQLPVDEAVRIASAAASALEYAHQHGVIHRDLKPENILMQAGQPVIADFGIALAVSNAGEGRITQTGLSLGTPQYMSPEQATGDRTLDARSDIYSLAAVTYEMLTGEPPHVGGTSQAIIARVLTETPRAIRVSRPAVPEYVESAVLRALEKIPADRVPSAGAFAEMLSGRVHVAPTSATRAGTASRGTPRGGRRAVALAALAGAAATLAVMFGIDATTPPPPAAVASFSLELPDTLAFAGGNGSRISMTRDGATIAFVATSKARISAIYLRSIDNLRLRVVPGTEGASSPTFCPDGRTLLFVQNRRLMRVNLSGGDPIAVSDSLAMVTGGEVPSATCGVDGTILFGRNSLIFRTSLAGGTSQEVLVADASADNRRGRVDSPFLLPSGRSALVSIRPPGTSVRVESRELGVLSLASGSLTRLNLRGATPRYSPTGHLLYADPTGALMAVRFDPEREVVEGTPTPLLNGVSVVWNRGGEFDVADNGTLVWIEGERRTSLVAVDRGGNARALSTPLPRIQYPRISPDGQKVALEVGTGLGTWEVWVYDIPSRAFAKLTTEFQGIRPAGWTRDSRRVAYVSNDTSVSPRNAAALLGWGVPDRPEIVARHELAVQEASVGPPGTIVAFSVNGNDGGSLNLNRDIYITRLGMPDSATALATSRFEETQPRLSPDASLLAYVSNESGQLEVYLRSLGSSQERVQVSVGGGVEVAWHPSGRQLFYRGPTHMMLATLTAGATPAITRRDTLFEDSYGRTNMGQFDVFPGGNELLLLQPAPSSERSYIMLNWPEALKRATVKP